MKQEIPVMINLYDNTYSSLEHVYLIKIKSLRFIFTLLSSFLGSENLIAISAK